MEVAVMKATVGLSGFLTVLLAGLFATSGALAQDEQTAPNDAPSPPPYESALAPPSMPPASAAGVPVPSQGQWIYTDRYGWIWVPAGSEATTVAAQPYVYLFAPTYGWTWFVSPWGFGPYRAGPWVHARGALPRVGVGPRAPYRYYGGPRVWYGYHGVTPHAYQPTFGAHFSPGRGAPQGGGRHR
jgi:hypothetical protein